MFKVLIALEEAGRTESLAEACQIFIRKIKEMIKNGGAAAQVIYESCMIETEIDGIKCMMNFDAIKEFSHAAGILKEDGSLRNKPTPYIPRDFAREVFLAAYRDSLTAFIAERNDIFSQMVAVAPTQEVSEPESCIVVVQK